MFRNALKLSLECVCVVKSKHRYLIHEQYTVQTIPEKHDMSYTVFMINEND